MARTISPITEPVMNCMFCGTENTVATEANSGGIHCDACTPKFNYLLARRQELRSAYIRRVCH
jgi:transcription elongation factor Elf1